MCVYMAIWFVCLTEACVVSLDFVVSDLHIVHQCRISNKLLHSPKKFLFCQSSSLFILESFTGNFANLTLMRSYQILRSFQIFQLCKFSWFPEKIISVHSLQSQIRSDLNFYNCLNRSCWWLRHIHAKKQLNEKQIMPREKTAKHAMKMTTRCSWFRNNIIYCSSIDYIGLRKYGIGIGEASCT